VINQVVAKAILERFGYRVDVANNGCEALKSLEENDYALVLMDCMMPVLNGYETTAEIRDHSSNVRNHAIPVIALTANAMWEDRDKCLAAGMDDYLSKPLEVVELLATVKKWLPFVSGGVSAQSSRKGTGTGPVDKPAECPSADNVIFDRDEFVMRNQGDLLLSHEVASIFIDSSPEYFDSISRSLAARDAGALRRSAHKLNGASANLALPLLSKSAGMIEFHAEAGDLEKAGQLLPELEVLLEQALTAIRDRLVTPQERASQ